MGRGSNLEKCVGLLRHSFCSLMSCRILRCLGALQFQVVTDVRLHGLAQHVLSVRRSCDDYSRICLLPGLTDKNAIRSRVDGFVCYEFLRDNWFMTQVSVEEMQRDLSACLQRVEAGETLLIVRAGKPVAEVKPVGASVETLRPFGLCKGEFTVPDDFDLPLPDDILKSFEGK